MRTIIGFFVFVVITSIGAWLEKRRMKRKLREGLGHEVGDLEVTSLKRWMEMPPNERRPPNPMGEPVLRGESIVRYVDVKGE